MKQFKQVARVGSMLLAAAGFTSAADLPTAKTIAAEMGAGWNVGNSLEVPSDPLAWGNPLPSKALIDSVKAAGFKTLRIPCAWYSHSDTTTNVIDPAWLAQVKTVVDYGIQAGLYVVINSHWDMGWLESHIDVSSQAKVNKRQGAYWRQIANTFKNYDHHLLFAGANEPAAQDASGTAFGPDRIAVLNSYHQTFIDTVRATGGNNATRTLIVQGPKTDIEVSKAEWTTLPVDDVADRLMAELHFYPYQFALMETDQGWGKVFWFWGEENKSLTAPDRNTTWCGPAYVDSMFRIVKAQFVDRNIPVLLGEFGAMKRMTLTGDSLALHVKSRRAYYHHVVKTALANGIIPVAWDAGGKGDLTMTVFDRKTGGTFDLGLLNAIRRGAGLSNLPGDTSLVPAVGSNAMRVLYSVKDSGWGQVDLGVAKPDVTPYDSIYVRAYAKGTTNYDSAGVAKFGYVTMSLATMSSNWTWREVSLGAPTMGAWKTYGVAIGTDTKTQLVPADPAKVDFFALQTYSNGFRGAIYVDYIVFHKKAGGYDTLYTFNQATPDGGKGNVQEVALVSVSSVAGDLSWQTATTTKWTVSVSDRLSARSGALRTAVSECMIRASFQAVSAGGVTVTVKDLQGRTLLSRSVRAEAGMNTFELPVSHRGLLLVHLQHDGRDLATKVSSY